MTFDRVKSIPSSNIKRCGSICDELFEFFVDPCYGMFHVDDGFQSNNNNDMRRKIQDFIRKHEINAKVLMRNGEVYIIKYPQLEKECADDITKAE